MMQNWRSTYRKIQQGTFCFLFFYLKTILITKLFPKTLIDHLHFVVAYYSLQRICCRIEDMNHRTSTPDDTGDVSQAILEALQVLILR